MCFWLLDELTRLKRQQGNQLRTVVVFHELFASGPPWRSAFWLSRLQATIAARLARQADALWTNTEHHARWLRKAAGPTVPLRMRPVFSNIGEPQAVRCNAMRVPRVVVFGSGTTRQRALDALRGQEERLRQLGIVELVEVGGGRPSRHLPRGLACRHAGRLAPAEIATLLESSRFGLLDYPSRYLAKSGVFAAYAAHGCVILNTSPLGRDTDGLFAGRDYLVLPALIGADVHTSAHEARSNDVLRWYARHRLAKQAQELLMLATQS
jgi:hypothetical protein